MPKSKVTTFGNNKKHCKSQASMTTTATHSVLALLKLLRLMMQDRQHHPPFPSLVINRNYLRFLGLWPLMGRFYRICNAIIVILLSIFALSITCDLWEASQDFVLFGDDLVVLLGLYLILLKICMYRQRIVSMENIIKEFERLHERLSQLSVANLKIGKLQRQFFLFEVFSLLLYTVLALFFAAAMCIQPIFTDQPLPYRSKYPFDLQQTPIFAFVYSFQCICTIYNLSAIVLIDNLGCHTFSQTALSLKILCLRIRKLGEDGVRDNMWADLREIVVDHQHIIRLINKINSVFYSNYVAQMVASTFMICLTAFEALLAQDQPMVALKFQIYMVSAFMQLFYWCWMGNMVYFDSLEVADAAFGIHDWFKQSPRFQRNLMFLIKRAQEPLVFRAKPFYAFEFQTLTGILSNSYSYFALLRTMND